MKNSVADAFADLLKSQYGVMRSPALKRVQRLRELFANNHGEPISCKSKRTRLSVVQSMRYDTGAAIPQAGDEAAGEEYVVQASVAAECEEYVIDGGVALVVQASAYAEEFVVGADIAPATKAQALAENRFDILELAPAATPIEADIVPPAAAPSYREEPSGAPVETSQAKATEDEFINDLQSILSGQKVFDAQSKQMMSKDELAKKREPTRPDERPAPEAKNSQEIFDRIAQSMQYANAYDIGTVELANRFADFDRMAELQRRAAEEKKAKIKAPAAAEPPPGIKPDTADFIRDLDAIRNKPTPQGNEAVSTPLETVSAAAAEPLSEARDKVVNQYWPMVRGAKYKGNAAEKAMWNLLLPGVDIEKMRQDFPGYTTCGALPFFLLKKLGGIEDPGILSGGLAGVRDGVPMNQKSADLDFVKRMFGPYAWIDDKANIFKGGAKHLGVWVPHDGVNRPKPGDIFLLDGNISKPGKPPMIGLRHIGLIVRVTKRNGTDKEEWKTGDAGQGGGADQQCVEQTRIYDPADRTVTGLADKGIVTGWVDLDLLVQKSAQKIAEIQAAATPAPANPAPAS